MLLLDHLGHHTGTHRLASLSKREAQALGHGHGGDQGDVQGGVVSGHHHLHLLGQDALAGHVGRAEEELGSVQCTS